MTEVPGRDDLDEQIARAISKLLGTQYKDVIRMMGNPPSVGNIPSSYWEGTGIEMTDSMAKELEKVYLAQAQALAGERGLPVDWDLINKRAITWARDYTFDLVKDINISSMEKLQDVTARYFRDAWTRKEFEDAILAEFGPVRAEMIAVTEITRAAARGEDAIWDELARHGIEMETYWSTLYDELVCEICGELDGQPAAGRDSGGPYWNSSAGTVRVPAHPRCRCNEANQLPSSYTQKPPEDYGKLEDVWQDEAKLARWIGGNSKDFGDFEKHGMRQPAQGRILNYRDRNVVYERACQDSVVKDIREYEEYIAWKGVPPTRLTDATKNIYYTMQQNGSDAYWAKAYNIPNFVSVATGGNGEITVYNGYSLGVRSLFHENAHNMAEAIWGVTDPPSGTVWRGLWENFVAGVGKEVPVTNYGKVAIAEDFAESVKFYMTDPGVLRSLSPSRYAQIKKLLEDAAYNGQ